MLEVLAPGPLTTVQDLGRPGYRALGVPVAGAADADALRVANLLVGNPEHAAGLEFTLAGPTLHFDGPRVIALAGGDLEASIDGVPVPAWRPVALAGGSELRIGRVLRGARGYLAISGGVNTGPVMGSRSTDLRCHFGGHHGRALKAGDRLPLGRGESARGRALRRRRAESRQRFMAANWWVAATHDLRGEVAWLHLLPGPDIAALDPRVLRTLRSGTWIVSNASDRMGLRFEGPEVPRVPVPEQISAAVLPGTVQLTPDGSPILLGVDAQTTGGYPRVAQVVRADLGRAMQLKPGDKVRPVLVDEEAAEGLRRVRARELERMRFAIAARLAED
jgi:antagonist of KipI